MSHPSRTTTQAKDQQVINGIRQELQSMTTLYLASQTFTPQSLEVAVQRRIALANGILTAKAAWEQAIADYETSDAETTRIVSDLRHLVIAAFGPDSEKLATFGFVPPKVPTLTPEQRALAVKRAKATRKARNTMGKKQKALIKGEVPPPAQPETTPESPAAT
jgi:hypothetical protein